jgi:predicted RNA binding protein YcfA (HicA-like mRNA interferase family)
MSHLPVISGREAIKAFSRYGFTIARQTGSHVIMVKHGVDVTLSVPLHDPIKRGTLRRLITDAGLTVEDFVTLL